MAVKDPANTVIDGLSATRDGGSEILYLTIGTAGPTYHYQAMSALWQLSRALDPLGLRVAADDTNNTTIAITQAPGKVTIDGAAYAYAGGTVDLASLGNGTLYVWAYVSVGALAIGSATAGAGWPTSMGGYIKLAEVTVTAGVITAILDRRGEYLLNSAGGTSPGRSAITGTTATAFTILSGGATAQLKLDTAGATGAFTGTLSLPASLGAARTWTLPDLTGTVLLTTSAVAAALTGTSNSALTILSGGATAQLKLDTAGATGAFVGTLSLPASLGAARTWTLPDLTGTVLLTTSAVAAALTGTSNSSLTILSGGATAQLKLDTAGATGAFTGTLSLPASLGAARTWTLPDATGAVVVTGLGNQVSATMLADALATALATYGMAITTQGSTATPSTVTITLKDARGNAIAAVNYLRVRICDSGGYAVATNATIAAGTNTTAMETHTAGKDITFRSHTDGTYQITLTDATAETMTLRVGPAPLSGRRGDWTPTQNVTHA